jgi:hypothetical protein
LQSGPAFLFGLWTAFLVFVALMADSGKDSNPLPALALLWPLAEIVWCWIWLLRHAGEYSGGRQRALGNVLAIAAIILPPFFMLAIIFSRFHPPDWLFLGLSLVVTIVCCRAARILWSEKKAQNSSLKIKAAAS